jgi:hypothetical protein
MDLNEHMQIEHVIRIREDGKAEDATGVHAPESTIEAHWDEYGMADILKEDEDAYVESLGVQGWTVMRGWSCGYLSGNSPLMHPSEYIGGRLAEHIRENPGLYVALSVSICPQHEDGESELAGWAVAFRDTTCKGEDCERQATPGDFQGMCLECNPYGDSMVMNSDPEYLSWLYRPEY